METLQKPKRVRSRPQRPKYSHLQNNGEIREIQIDTNVVISSRDNIFKGDLVITPYSEYIPISYITANSIDEYRSSDSTYSIASSLRRVKKFSDKKLKNLCVDIANKRSPLMDIILNRDMERRDIRVDINNFLKFDRPQSIAENLEWAIHRLCRIGDIFREGVFTSLSTRGYSGVVGTGLLALSRIEGLTPTIIIVTPKENYLYQKLRWLTTGKIDLTKCFVLIDRDLDYTNFLPISFRSGVYRTILKPYLETLNIDVFKVPTSFIKEKCFLGEYKMKATNITEMKREKESLIKEFCKTEREKYYDNAGLDLRSTRGVAEFGGPITSETAQVITPMNAISHQGSTIQMGAQSYTLYEQAIYQLRVDPYMQGSVAVPIPLQVQGESTQG